MTYTAGVLQCVAASFSEGMGKEGEAVGLALYFRECLDCLELDDGDDMTEYLWVGIKGKG